MVLILMMVLIFISMVLVFNHGDNLQDGVGVVGLANGSLGGVGPISLEHVVDFKDGVGDVGLHCNVVPSKLEYNFPKYHNPKPTTLDLRLMTNLNLGLSPPKKIGNTLPSKSSILDSDHEPIPKPISKKCITLNAPSMSTRTKVSMQEKVFKHGKKRNPTHPNT
jgi:hypothetical protein